MTVINKNSPPSDISKSIDQAAAATAKEEVFPPTPQEVNRLKLCSVLFKCSKLSLSENANERISEKSSFF